MIELEVHNEAKKFGIIDGIAIPIYRSGGYFAAFFISSQNNLNIEYAEIELLNLFANLLHDKIYETRQEDIFKTSNQSIFQRVSVMF